MRPRPQPNRSRGLLRAAAATVVLVALLIIALVLTSSFAAPTAKAPTAPPTPGAGTALPAGTARPVPTLPSTLLPRPTPRVTATPHKKTSFRIPGPSRHGGATLAAAVGRSMITPSPRGAALVYFLQRGWADAHNPLLLARQRGSPGSVIGYGDPLVRPVWSRNGRFLLYVRVAQTRDYPGARWTLVQYDTLTGRARALVSHPSMGMTPLGWSGGRPLYIEASTTDTALFAVERNRPRLLEIVMPQPLVSAALSPDGRYLAFGAPTNCRVCSLDVLTIATAKVRIGPTGMQGEQSLAWSADSSVLAASFGPHLALINVPSLDAHLRAAPSALQGAWRDPLRVQVIGSRVRITDPVTLQGAAVAR